MTIAGRTCGFSGRGPGEPGARGAGGAGGTGGAGEERVDVQWLADKRVTTMLGVGHPNSVIAQLERAGARVMANLPVADHERYDRARINVARGLSEGTDGLVLTAKDWVKAKRLVELESWSVPIIVPHLEMDVHHGADDLRELIRSTVEGFSGELPSAQRPSP